MAPASLVVAPASCSCLRRACENYAGLDDNRRTTFNLVDCDLYVCLKVHCKTALSRHIANYQARVAILAAYQVLVLLQQDEDEKGEERGAEL